MVERSVAPKGTSIGWGLVGCGWVARDYVAPAMQRAPNSHLVAACDLDSAALNAIVPGEKILRTQHFDELLSAPGLDAVYIATPNDSHRALTEAAAGAGKHVFCEKPMATCYDDAVAMVRACERAGVQYATAFDQRFHALHIALRAAIASGVLGTVTTIRVHYACWLPPDWAKDNWRADPKRAGGGAFIDLAPHGLDLVQSLLGETLEDVQVLLQRRVFDYAVDDGAVVIGRFPSGTLALLNVAYNCPEGYPRRTLEILGTKAKADAIDTMGQTPGGRVHLTTASGVRTELTVAAADDESPFQKGIERFARSLLEGTPFPYLPSVDLHTAWLLDLTRCGIENKQARRAVSAS